MTGQAFARDDPAQPTRDAPHHDAGDTPLRVRGRPGVLLPQPARAPCRLWLRSRQRGWRRHGRDLRRSLSADLLRPLRTADADREPRVESGRALFLLSRLTTALACAVLLAAAIATAGPSIGPRRSFADRAHLQCCRWASTSRAASIRKASRSTLLRPWRCSRSRFGRRRRRGRVPEEPHGARRWRCHSRQRPTTLACVRQWSSSCRARPDDRAPARRRRRSRAVKRRAGCRRRGQQRSSRWRGSSACIFPRSVRTPRR